ncbi:MAG: hypothetical protein QW542_06375 [Thermoproteota archaeon]
MKASEDCPITFHYNDSFISVMKIGVIIIQIRLTGEKHEIMKDVYELLVDWT